MNTKTLFSHNSDEWETPQNFYDELDKEFRFTLDVCATNDNHKCDRFFTKEDNGLEKSWGGKEFGATPRILKLTNGLQKRFTKQKMITQLLLC